MQEKTLTKQKISTSVHDAAHTDSELYKVGTITTAAFAGAIGVWGLICLASSMADSSGPVELVKNLWGAITGM